MGRGEFCPNGARIYVNHVRQKMMGFFYMAVVKEW